MAGRKTPRKKNTWGGARKGAGRKKGGGKGPSPKSRRNRVAVMFTDVELRALRKHARARKVPLSTCAHQILSRRIALFR